MYILKINYLNEQYHERFYALINGDNDLKNNHDILWSDFIGTLYEKLYLIWFSA